METVRAALLMVGSYVLLATTSHAVPLAGFNDKWEQNVLTPVVTSSASSSSGRCWDWLPVAEVSDDIPTEDVAVARLQARREVTNSGSNSVADSWRSNDAALGEEIRPVLATRELPSRIAKKDAQSSRSWGVSGMPFSVLYLSSHGPRTGHNSNAYTDANQQQESSKPIEGSTTQQAHSNNRIGVRKGAQPRRQYSIIPQLYVSYGWGPLGK